MAFVKYTNLTTPNAILEKMAEYATSVGWSILANCVDDLDVISRSLNDGKKLVIQNPTATLFASFRSANGYQIFPKQAKGVDLNTWVSGLPTIDNTISGIGCICSTGYSAINKWYDQDNVPRYKNALGLGDQIGTGIHTVNGSNHTLYCNNVTTPANMLYFTIEVDGVFQHLAVGEVEKLSSWTGGIVFTGSLNSYHQFSGDMTSTAIETKLLPVFSTDKVSNTFLYIEMDDAPSRGNIKWASSGSNIVPTSSNDVVGFGVCYTGKQLALPIRTQLGMGVEGWTPKIPHYGYLQSQNTLDGGRNSNTLNCITVNLPLLCCVIRDPDDLKEFSPVGNIAGCYFVSIYNMASGETYEISYPQSGALHQVFPMTKRRGKYGYDGISIAQ